MCPGEDIEGFLQGEEIVTIEEIRSRVREYIDDPDIQVWTDSRLNGHLDDAVNEMMTLLDQNMPEYAGSIQGDYDVLLGSLTDMLAAQPFWEGQLPTDFRRPISVFRQPSGSVTYHVPVKIIPFTDAWLYKGVDACATCYFRHISQKSEGGAVTEGQDEKDTWNRWVIGVPYPVASVRLTVIYVRTPKKVSEFSENDELYDVPEHFHGVLCLGTAVRCLLSENRDPTRIQQLYDRGLMTLMGPEFKLISRGSVTR